MSWADDMDRAGIGYDRDTNGNRVTPPDAHMFTHRRIEFRHHHRDRPMNEYQMTPNEVRTPDDAMAYMLQTHLCYSNIQPDDLAFRVLKERLAVTGHVVALAAVPAHTPGALDVERLAEAICNREVDANGYQFRYSDFHDDGREQFRVEARALLAAYEAASPSEAGT